MMKIVFLALLCLLSLCFACGGGSMSTPPPSSSLSVSLASSSTQVFPGQADLTVNATVTRTGTTSAVTLTIQGLPTGATSQIQSPGSGNSGSVTLGPGTAAAGNYALTIKASDGTAQGTASFTFNVGAAVQVATATTGRLELAMSTSFQPAEWDYTFFQQFGTPVVTELGNLLPQHIRLQGISQGVPQVTSTTWDFTKLDAITQPVLGVGDKSPEFQIAKAPPFMYVNNDTSAAFVDTSFVQFSQYTQNLVRYYNKGGFTAADGTHVSPSSTPITWWGIYNEPEFNNVTPQQYVDLYNRVVPAMQAIDPSIKFVGMEFASYQPDLWVPPFVSGVTAQVDAVATHFYSTCNQADSDQKLFATIPDFANVLQQKFFAPLQTSTNPRLTPVPPLWITENNVNADFNNGGKSACNGTTFVTDQRGSSAFFAAWRPYVFSQVGKIGVRALYHWDFNADQQFGEVDVNNNAQLLLSYWVDYWLARIFASPPGADILDFTTTNTPDGLEILPVKNADGSMVIMIANHAVNSASDNNGPGAPRGVLLDVSALGTFTTASTLTLDATTSPTAGPSPVSITVAPQITIQMNGYGVVFLTLK